MRTSSVERHQLTVRIRADLLEALDETAHEIPCGRRLLIERAVEDYLQRLELPAPNAVTLAEIAEQRQRGWPDFHPEDYCHRCGGRNVSSWCVDSDRFNAALGPPDQHPYNGIVCPGCFVELHEAATGLHCTWTLTPLTPFRPAEARAAAVPPHNTATPRP